MNVVELIRKKREGVSLQKSELQYLISGYVGGNVPDYQMSAFLMACYFRGMSEEEMMTFTELMLHSGEVIDLSDIAGIKVDKHSTGGVGDKVSLILAPMVAACGVPVPMISGRGLGHTGGTLDKLESIPGFRTSLSIPEYKAVIRQTGLVMVGQTSQIAPADRKMYALRDVTGTVECIPLIAGSIMSKKLAEGIDALVLDIKTGRGAFMPTRERAVELAEALVMVGTAFGKQTIGYITDMSQPLGKAIGNWLEVVECVECLRGNEEIAPDLMELTYLLSGTMVYLGGKAASIQAGISQCKDALQSGRAYEKFLALVEAQGGDPRAIENTDSYPLSQHWFDIKAGADGVIHAIDALELGLASIVLGAGRQTIDDPIDPKAGIVLKKKVGEHVETKEPLAIVYTDREEVIPAARERISKAVTIRPTPSAAPPLVYHVVDKDGIHPPPT